MRTSLAAFALFCATSLAHAQPAPLPVTVDNFVRAEILNGTWKFPEAQVVN